MKGVAFFFSSVAIVQRRRKGKKKNEENQDQDEEENDTTEEKVLASISYWITVQSPSGMRVSNVPLHSVLLQNGIEVTAKALNTSL